MAGGAFETLRDTAGRCVSAGLFPGTPEQLALAAWSLVHGLVSLELAGTVPPGFDVVVSYEAILRTTVTGMLTVAERPAGRAPD